MQSAEFVADVEGNIQGLLNAAAQELPGAYDGDLRDFDEPEQPPVEGATFTLTPGVDTIVGTADNDIINALPVNATTGAAADTLNAFDVIDGGAGTDAFNLTATAANNNTLVGTVRNVEIINITGSDNIDAAGGRGRIDADFFEGSTNINVTGVATDVVDVEGQTIGFNASAGMTKGVAFADDVTTASVTVNNSNGYIGFSGDDLEAVTVSGTVRGATRQPLATWCSVERQTLKS